MAFGPYTPLVDGVSEAEAANINVIYTDLENATADDIPDGTTNKAYTATEQTKLSGIETAADVTDATNVAAAGAVMEADTSTASMAFVIDEDSFATNSATKVPTQQSAKAYVDAVKGGAKGFVNHGATAGTSRPTGYASIEWLGSVEPTNMANGDTWVVTS
jgi:hypothetical protein